MDKPILPDLFKTIQEIHPRLQGWAEMDKALTLASLVVATRPDVVYEVGVFGGASFLPMALACKAIKRGLCIGVDPWSREAAIKGQSGPNHSWWDNVDYDGIYKGFMKFIADHKLEGYTRIHRKESDKIDPPNAINILSVDGNHGPQAYTDIIRFCPKVVVGGYCLLDDLNWDGGNVSRGERWILQNGFKMLYPIQNGALYQRVR